jgi:RNA polymerase sigma-70 factor (ECF subfamily)
VSSQWATMIMYHERLGMSVAASGDFAKTMDRHSGSLRSYARRLAGNAADAEDLVQDTMLRCWSARRRFQPETNFGAWSRIVMRNSFLSSHRRDRFHANLPEEAFDRLPSEGAGQDLAIEMRDIEWALEQLNPDQRNAVTLAAKGVSSEEAAAQLTISEGAFKSRVARGRVHLRELIDDPDAQPYRALAAKAQSVRTPRNWKGVMIG